MFHKTFKIVCVWKKIDLSILVSIVNQIVKKRKFTFLLDTKVIHFCINMRSLKVKYSK